MGPPSDEGGNVDLRAEVAPGVRHASMGPPSDEGGNGPGITPVAS